MKHAVGRVMERKWQKCFAAHRPCPETYRHLITLNNHHSELTFLLFARIINVRKCTWGSGALVCVSTQCTEII